MLLPPPFPAPEELIAGSSLVIIAAVEAKLSESDRHLPQGRFTKPRQRQSVADIFNLMGESIFWHAFHMTYDSFWWLHAM